MTFGGSLWLTPKQGSDLEVLLKETIQLLSSRGSEWGMTVTCPFPPHMTITSGVAQGFMHADAGQGAALGGSSGASVDIRFAELVLGEAFFKRIFLRLERTPSLLAWVRSIRQVAVEESYEDLEAFIDSFDPHISLAYATGFTNAAEAQKLIQAIDLQAKLARLDLSQELTRVVLMDTASCDAPPSCDTPASWTACLSPVEIVNVLQAFQQ